MPTYPSARQLLLLQAALLPNDPAGQAFADWQAAHSLETIRSDEYQLLPLLYHTLQRQSIEHPWKTRLTGIYRRTWYANQIVLRPLKEIAQSFEEAAIPTLWVGGALLAQTVYASEALRPVDSLELTVSRNSAHAAVQLLTDAGWQARNAANFQPDIDDCRWLSSREFVRAEGETVRLHWHVLPAWPTEQADSVFFARRLRHQQIGDLQVDTLEVTDHLLRVCTTLDRQPLIALADATQLVQTAAIDWSHLVAMAQACRISGLVGSVLQTLAFSLEVAVPHQVITELGRNKHSRFEQTLLNRLTADAQAQSPPTVHLQRHWHQFRRNAQAQNIRPLPIAFLDYLTCHYALSHWRQLPGYAFQRLTQSIRNRGR